jgi:hypothetical protein
MLKITTVEREIGERVRAAKLKLRFDRVVRRLAGDLKATLASALPEGQSDWFLNNPSYSRSEMRDADLRTGSKGAA